MSMYQGQFEVINLTGGVITEVSITHTTQTYGPDNFSIDKMTLGQVSIPKKWQSSSINQDYWAITFILSNGTLVHVAHVECTLNSSMDGTTIQIELYAGYFMIAVPSGEQISYAA